MRSFEMAALRRMRDFRGRSVASFDFCIFGTVGSANEREGQERGAAANAHVSNALTITPAKPGIDRNLAGKVG
jgi:hypothetical protein